MKSKLLAAASSIALCSSSVLAIGVGSRLTVHARAGAQAPGLPSGNMLSELKFAPVLNGTTLGFIAKRSGPQTGAGGFDHVVYTGGVAPPAPFVVVADSDLPPLSGFRVLLNADTISASLLALVNTANGAKDAVITTTQAGATVRAQVGTVVPGTGGRVLRTIEEALAPRPADRIFFVGEIGASFEFGMFATSDAGLSVVAVPGSTFFLPSSQLTLDFLDRALLGVDGADSLGLAIGGAQVQGGPSGPFVGTVRIPISGSPVVTPVVIPGQASPPAFVAGSIEAWIDFAVGPGNQGALTTLVKTSALPAQYIEQTAIMHLNSPNPFGDAALLVAPRTAVVATPSTQGSVPIGTVMLSHYDRVFFSGERMYLPIWTELPNLQSRVALASAVQSQAARSAANAPLVTELRALLLTQAPAPGLTGPKVQSIDKVSASNDGYALVEVTLSGTGVNAGNNKAWYMCTPAEEVVLVVREGQNIELAPGISKVLNAVTFHANGNTGDGLPNSLGSSGTWAFQADLDGGTSTAIIVASIEGNCPADLNGDGLVEDADFVIFLAAYNILDCQDPTMAAGCPSDLNADDLVDDADFVIFLAAYNELVCP